MARNPATISKLLHQAMDFYYQGQYENAESTLKTLLEKDPASEKALLLLAECTKSLDLKIKCLRKAIEINPYNASAKQLLQSLEKEKKRIKQKAKVIQEKATENRVTTAEKKHKKTEETTSSARGNGKGTKKARTRSDEKKPAKRSTAKTKANSVELETSEEEPQTKPKDKGKALAKLKKGTIPEKVRRAAEDDFFSGFREGINVSARLETGMFGKAIVVDGIRMSPFDGPSCFYLERSQIYSECHNCTFFSPRNCLLRFDEYLLDDIRRFTEIREERAEALERKRRVITRTIQKELKAHGRPLHYTVIAKIIMGRYPKFRLNAHSVYHYLLWHPELFERVDAGVYRAK